jgi:hypothetical protein
MRFFLKFLTLVFSILFVLIGSSITLAYFYQNDIEQLVIKELNRVLIQPIEVEDVEISTVKNFPFTSIRLNNIMIVDCFGEDTLINAQKIVLKFNAIDLYNKNYHIQEVELINGKASVYYKNDSANYNIWKTKQDTTSKSKSLDFKLKNANLKNFRVKYKQNETDLYSEFVNKNTQLQLDLSNELIKINLQGDLYNKSLIVNNNVFLDDKEIKLDIKTIIDSSIQQINGSIDIDGIPLITSFANSNKNLSINIKSENKLSIKKLLDIIPSNLLTSLDEIEIKGNCDLNIAYNDNKEEGPSTVVDFDSEKISLKSTFPYQLKNGKFKGKFTSINNIEKIDVKNFSALLNQEPISGDFELTNFNDPIIKTKVKTSLNLSKLDKYQIETNLKKLEGTAKIDLFYEGKIGLKNNYQFDLSAAKKEANIDLKNLILQINDNSSKWYDGNVKLELVNEQLDIKDLQFKIGEKSNLKLSGAIENIFKYTFLKNAPLKIGGIITSDWLHVDEIFTPDTNNTNQSPSQIIFPKNIIANINVNLTDFLYDRFHMRHFKTNLSYKNKLMRYKGISLETMSGLITGDLSFEQVENNNIRLISSSKMDNINVRQLFYGFHNFGQNTMRYSHLRGTINSEIYLRNEWDSYFNNLDNKLYSFIDLKISKGQLLDFEPMKMMSSYISLTELERIKFSTLENQIEIKDNKIEIPFMEIHSSAIDIALSGTHYFDNKIDYDLKILLNEILSNKLKRKNKRKKTTEFGVVEDDGVKGLTMFLKMSGTVDDPEISPGTIKLRESLNKKFKNEKKEFKNVVKKEFGKNSDEQQNQIENTDYNNIIEWED